MARPALHLSARPLQQRLLQWQAARTWARLIREAERLWRVDVRELHRLAASELGQLQREVPQRLRRRVNRWLQRYGVATRLCGAAPNKKPPFGRGDR